MIQDQADGELSHTENHKVGHMPEQNCIAEMVTMTLRESLAPVILTDYDHAKSEISRNAENYNNNMRRSSLNNLTPVQYYRGKPEVQLTFREAKIDKLRILKRKKHVGTKER